MKTVDYCCSKCEHIFVAENLGRVGVGYCPACRRSQKLERIYLEAPAVAVGMRSGAVKGSGFHATDYANPKSDLVTGRALEHSQKLYGWSDEKVASLRNRKS
jgi:predicted nucleic acid-binding Zn ribbon protein